MPELENRHCLLPPPCSRHPIRNSTHPLGTQRNPLACRLLPPPHLPAGPATPSCSAFSSPHLFFSSSFHASDLPVRPHRPPPLPVPLIVGNGVIRSWPGWPLTLCVASMKTVTFSQLLHFRLYVHFANGATGATDAPISSQGLLLL